MHRLSVGMLVFGMVVACQVPPKEPTPEEKAAAEAKAEADRRQAELDAYLAKVRAEEEARNARFAEVQQIMGDLVGKLGASWKGKGAWTDAALKQMKTKTDEFQGVTWYRDRNERANRGLRLYFGLKKPEPHPWPLRLIIDYTGDDWVFWERVIIKADDEIFDLPLPRDEIHRDNSYGTVWEIGDHPISIGLPDPADVENLKMLRAVLTAKVVKMRFQGDRVSDITIPASQIASMRNVLGAYAAVYPEVLPAKATPVAEQ